MPIRSPYSERPLPVLSVFAGWRRSDATIAFPVHRWCVVVFLGVFLSGSHSLHSQVLPPSDTLVEGRVRGVSLGLGAGYLASMAGLHELWYKEHRGQSFHFFDDSDHWLQMDKAGHLLTGYQISRYSGDLFRWAGLTRRKSALWGAGVGLFFLTSVEVFDGMSEAWGFSVWDAAFNLGGVALYAGQEFLWEEQRVIPKFSYFPTDYAPLRPETLGSGSVERMLKDYNGQRIWLTVMPEAFGWLGEGWPEWLGISVGYGAEGMLGGSHNPALNAAGAPLPHFDRRRRVFLSLDIDTRRIPTNSQFLRSVFGVVGFLKVPAPALEWFDGSFRGHWVMF